MGSKWARAYNLLQDYVVRIETPDSFGTGVLVSNSDHAYGIATARHVIARALDDKKEIRVVHVPSGRFEVAVEPRAVCCVFQEQIDLALIIMAKGQLGLPDQRLRLLDPAQRLVPGSDVAWCGYPYISSHQLCVFRGCISGWIGESNCYLVDGVAINGVSGGPVFVVDGPKDRPPLMLVGIITAYLPNTANKDALPGVSIAQCTSPFFKAFRDMEASITVTKFGPGDSSPGKPV